VNVPLGSINKLKGKTSNAAQNKKEKNLFEDLLTKKPLHN